MLGPFIGALAVVYNKWNCALLSCVAALHGTRPRILGCLSLSMSNQGEAAYRHCISPANMSGNSMSDRVVESATAFLDPRSKNWHLPRAQDCWPRCFGMASICHLAWQWRVCETCVKTSKTGSKETKLFWKWHILMKLTCQRPSLWSALGDLLWFIATPMGLWFFVCQLKW